MTTDQLFKKLLKTFFAEFLALFLPEVAAGADPASFTFLTPETFTNFPTGRRRTADLVAELQTTGGVVRRILIHTEVQGKRESGFDQRVWEYNVLQRLTTGKPVISVALLLYRTKKGVALRRYGDTLFGRRYPLLHYWQISLPDLKASDFLDSGFPLALGLATAMQPGHGGSSLRSSYSGGCTVARWTKPGYSCW